MATGFLTDIAEKHPKLPVNAFYAAEQYLINGCDTWKKGMLKGESSLAQFASFTKDGDGVEAFSSAVRGDACHARLATRPHDVLKQNKIVCVAQPIFEGKGESWGTTNPEATTIYLNWIISDDNPFAWILDDRCRSVEYIREKGAIFNVQDLPLGPCVHMFKVLRIIHEAPRQVEIFADMVKEGVSGRIAYLISQGFSSSWSKLSFAQHWCSFNTNQAALGNAASYVKGEIPPKWSQLFSGNSMYGCTADSSFFNSWSKKDYEEATKANSIASRLKNIDAWGMFNPPPETSYNPYKSVGYSRDSVIFFAKKWQEELNQEQLKVAA